MNNHETDVFFMQKALDEAKKSLDLNEVPVGCVITKDDKIISSAFNHREQSKNALCHAEIEAINNACLSLGGWRLNDCTIYITLEPCPMCAGAIINSQMKRVVYGCKNTSSGSFGTVTDLSKVKGLYTPEIIGQIKNDECYELIHSFFKRLRENAT